MLFACLGVCLPLFLTPVRLITVMSRSGWIASARASTAIVPAPKCENTIPDPIADDLAAFVFVRSNREGRAAFRAEAVEDGLAT